jgi:hypothetical protein
MLHPGWIGCPVSLAIFPEVWMTSGEEGKLLAGAAGFIHPGGAIRMNSSGEFVQRFLFVNAKKSRFASFAGACIPPHSHQGEREKNEYS